MIIANKINLMYNYKVDSPTGRKGRNLTALPHTINKVKCEKVVFMFKKICPVCGKEFMSSHSYLSNRDKYCSKECSYKAKIKDLTGQRFGKLTVIEYKGSNKGTGSLWLCKCDCGNEKIITSRNLLNKTCKSCGCYSKDNPAHITHNLYHTRLHNIWIGMKSRCYNKNNKRYKNYGGRGIKVCEEWQEFKSFYEWAIINGYNQTMDRGECTIDRIDINGDYSPDNCQFINIKKQQRNKTNTRYVNYKGKLYCLAELAEMLNLNYKYLWQKLKRNNWDTSILFENKELPETKEPEL